MSSNLAAPTKHSLILSEWFDPLSMFFAPHCLNCGKTPLDWLRCTKTLATFVCSAVERRQRLTLYLKFHLRVLLEHLRIALPEQLYDPYRPPRTRR